MQNHGPTLRSLYRRFLRELPRRQPSALANPSPIQHRIRSGFSTQPESQPNEEKLVARMQNAEQYIEYLKAQRTYTTLVERYNPGMNMLEEDRVRLSARRVGMDMPVQYGKGSK